MNAYAVLLDLDGTLLDSTHAYYEITRRACAALDWPDPPADLMRTVMVLRRHPVEILFGESAPDDPRRQALTDAALRIWEGVVAECVRPYPDTLAVLQQLHGAGIRLGIVTDSNDFVVSQLTGLPACPPFDVIVTRARSGARKPDPVGIRLALAELGVAPQAAIYIGDNPADIEAGRAAGVRALGISTGAATHADLVACAPDGVLRSLTELAGQVRPGAPILSGAVTTGRGAAGGFLQLPWVRRQLEALLGRPYFPGTLNLTLSPGAAALRLRHRDDGTLLQHELVPEPGFCSARCHPVLLHHGPARAALPAVALWPTLDDYPEAQLELVCAIPLREAWQLADGAQLGVEYRRA